MEPTNLTPLEDWDIEHPWDIMAYHCQICDDILPSGQKHICSKCAQHILDLKEEKEIV